MNDNIISEWNKMSAEAQVNLITACIRKAASKEHRGQMLHLHGHEINEFVNETWERITNNLQADKLTATNERRAAQGKRPLKLVSVVYNAARASIAAVYYADTKHGAAYDWEISDGEGNAASFLETCCGDVTENTETAAIIRADVGRLKDGLDEIGRTILEMIMDGMTEREIGKAVGISGVAVHKRIVKMRSVLTQAIA